MKQYNYVTQHGVCSSTSVIESLSSLAVKIPSISSHPLTLQSRKTANLLTLSNMWKIKSISNCDSTLINTEWSTAHKVFLLTSSIQTHTKVRRFPVIEFNLIKSCPLHDLRENYFDLGVDSCTCLFHFLFAEITEGETTLEKYPRLNGPIQFCSSVMRWVVVPGNYVWPLSHWELTFSWLFCSKQLAFFPKHTCCTRGVIGG